LLKRRWFLTTVLLVTFAAPAASRAATPEPATPQHVTPEQIDQAIEKAKDWLYSKQANGHWDNDPPPREDQRGGMTAFVV
jgi:hypothetical protein